MKKINNEEELLEAFGTPLADEHYEYAQLNASLVLGKKEKKLRHSHIFEKEENEYYREEPWADRQLLEECELFNKFDKSKHLLDCFCGSGTVVREAWKLGFNASGSDIIQRWNKEEAGFFLRDFSNSSAWAGLPKPYYIVSNPPYKDSDKWIEIGLERTERVLAYLLPIGRLTGKNRTPKLRNYPLRYVYMLSPRVNMPPGKMIEAGYKPSGARVDHCWMVFDKDYKEEPVIRWIIKNEKI